MTNFKCDICLEDKGVTPYSHLAPLIKKHLGKQVNREVLLCEQCVQLLELWEDFSTQAKSNLGLTHPDTPQENSYASYAEVCEYSLNNSAAFEEEAQAVMVCSTNLTSSLNDPVDTCNDATAQGKFSECILDPWTSADPSFCVQQDSATLRDPLEVDIKPTLPLSDSVPLLIPYPCSECNKKFLFAKSIRLHNALKHSKEVSHKTQQTVNFKTLLNINKEVTKSVSKKCVIEEKNRDLRVCKNAFVCPKCNISIGSKELMISHLLDICCEKLDNNFVCIYCTQQFNSLRGLNFHIRKHLNDTFSLQCQQCDVTFQSMQALQKHVKEEHRSFKQTNGLNQRFRPKLLGVSKKSKLPFIRKYEVLRHMKKSRFDKKVSNIAINNVNYNLQCDLKTPNENHTCKSCGSIFETDRGLKRHFTKYHEQNTSNNLKLKFQCKYCKYRFGMRKALLMHLRVHTRNLAHGLVKKVSESRSQMKQNCGVTTEVESCNKNAKKCEYCSRLFPTEELLRVHLKDSHHKFQCDICSRNFDTSRGLLYHMMYHNKISKNQDEDLVETKTDSQQKQWVCSICSIDFTSKNLLENHCNKFHMTSKNTIINCKFKCKYCGSRFMTVQALASHVKNHYKTKSNLNKTKPVTSETFPCDYCHEVFHAKNQLHDHMKSEHLITKSTNNQNVKYEERKPSEDCSSPTQSGNNRALGYITKNKKYKIRKYICHTCKKSFLTLAALISHTRVHSKIKSQQNKQCTQCLVYFSNKQRLENHKCATTTEKTSCNMCNLVFSSPLDLNLHMTTFHQNHKELKSLSADSNEKINDSNNSKDLNFKVMCNICNKILCNRSYLNDHIRRMHNQANIPCKICKAMFFSKASLDEHVKTHSSSVGNKQSTPHVKVETREGDNVVSVKNITNCPYCKSQVRCSVLEEHIKVLHSENYGKESETNVVKQENHVFEKYYKNRDSLYFCNFCLKSESSVSKIVKHIKGDHL